MKASGQHRSQDVGPLMTTYIQDGQPQRYLNSSHTPLLDLRIPRALSIPTHPPVHARHTGREAKQSTAVTLSHDGALRIQSIARGLEGDQLFCFAKRWTAELTPVVVAETHTSPGNAHLRATFDYRHTLSPHWRLLLCRKGSRNYSQKRM